MIIKTARKTHPLQWWDIRACSYARQGVIFSANIKRLLITGKLDCKRFEYEDDEDCTARMRHLMLLKEIVDSLNLEPIWRQQETGAYWMNTDISRN